MISPHRVTFKQFNAIMCFFLSQCVEQVKQSALTVMAV